MIADAFVLYVHINDIMNEVLRTTAGYIFLINVLVENSFQKEKFTILSENSFCSLHIKGGKNKNS